MTCAIAVIFFQICLMVVVARDSIEVTECGKQNTLKTLADRLVVSGDLAYPGEWPWQVAIYKDYRFNCGASIITNEWVVTAAHCLSKKTYYGSVQNISPWRLDVRVGSRSLSKATFHRVAKVYTHPKYIASSPFPNDIGLIRLSSPLNFTKTIRPICLPETAWKKDDVQECYVTGWGHTIHAGFSFDLPDSLYKAKMEIRPLHDCATFAPGINAAWHICAAGARRSVACNGDSGGPLSCRDSTDTWKLIGVVSAGPTGCPVNEPDSFTRVASYVAWINHMIQN